MLVLEGGSAWDAPILVAWEEVLRCLGAVVAIAPDNCSNPPICMLPDKLAVADAE